jgi:hypothetical protein
MLDAIGERYGMLPSQVLRHASTFDVTVMDIALSYQRHRENVSKGDYTETYETPDLMTLMQRAREQHRG